MVKQIVYKVLNDVHNLSLMEITSQNGYWAEPSHCHPLLSQIHPLAINQSTSNIVASYEDPPTLTLEERNTSYPPRAMLMIIRMTLRFATNLHLMYMTLPL